MGSHKQETVDDKHTEDVKQLPLIKMKNGHTLTVNKEVTGGAKVC